MLLRSAAAAASKSLIVSYPRMDVAQSRARVPSFYALEVVRAAEGRLPSLREFEKRAAAKRPARLDWPAPADPRDAIDDAEYDLASLNASLKLRGAAATGSARYLMQTNERSSRSLRTRGRRWRNFWSSADGIVDPDAATLQALDTHRLARRSYSPSSLQHFAACPYRFLLHAVFQLRPREDPARLEQMDPLTRGALFHSAQFELFRELARADLLPVTEARLLESWTSPTKCWIAWRPATKTNLHPRFHASGKVKSRTCGPTCAAGCNMSPPPNPIGYRSISNSASACPPVRIGIAASTIEEAAHFGRCPFARLHRSDRTSRDAQCPAHHRSQNRQSAPTTARNMWAAVRCYSLCFTRMAAETLLGESVESGRLFYCTQRGDFSTIDIPLNDEGRGRLRRILQADRCLHRRRLPSRRPANRRLLDVRLHRGVRAVRRDASRSASSRDRLDPLIEIRHSP